MNALFLILVSLLPSSRDTDKPVFNQFIFWRFSEPLNAWPGYHVVAWRLDKAVESRPVTVANGFRMDWFDAKDKELKRTVYSRWFVVTACNWDAELTDRVFVPEQHRKGLLTPRKETP